MDEFGDFPVSVYGELDFVCRLGNWDAEHIR
jgi:hypothetical protein